MSTSSTAEDSIARDAAAVAGVLAGDDEVFREIVLRYQGLVFCCTRAITRNEADAADAAQEAFIRLHRHLDQFDARRPLKPYLLRIAANCARDLVSRRARAPFSAETAALESVPDPRTGPAGKAIGRERRAAVRSLVNTLPRTLREVCSLFYLADCACREVAEILQMSENAVKVALHRARRRLRQSDLAEWRAMQ